jgi:hypothetical protein
MGPHDRGVVAPTGRAGSDRGGAADRSKKRPPRGRLFEADRRGSAADAAGLRSDGQDRACDPVRGVARRDRPLAPSARSGGGESFTIEPSRAALSTIHTDTLYAAALAGMGITGLPSFVAEAALLENALERVMPSWHLLSMTIYAGIPTRKHVPARTRAFIDFLVQAFGGEDRDPWLIAAGCETVTRNATSEAEAADAAIGI